MAIQETIKARLRAKFPKANLSKSRVDAIVANLSPNLSDDADESAIDLALTDYNNAQVLSFEDIAKLDDKVRTSEANRQKDTATTSTTGSTQTDTETQSSTGEADDIKSLLKALATEVQNLKAEKQQQSIQQQLKERLKDVDPDFYKYAALPTPENLDVFVEGVQNDFIAMKQRLVNGSTSDSRTTGAQGAGSGKKEATDEEVAAIF